MTPEAQRIAIAEACGWEHVTWNGGDSIPFGDNPKGNRSRRAYDHLPDYLKDLNAMHDAESLQLEKDGWRFQCGYLINLREVGIRRRKDCNAVQVDFWIMYATAAQRAEAFLRTLGKWDDSK